MTAPNSELQPVTMYFDGTCPVCSREVRAYQKLDRDRAIRWQDVSESEVELGQDHVSQAEALAILHARLPDGRLVTGVDAFIAVWERLPGLKPLARLARWRPAAWMLEKGYGWYAPRRKRLTRLLEPAGTSTS